MINCNQNIANRKHKSIAMQDLTNHQRVLLWFGGAIASIALICDNVLRKKANFYNKKVQDITKWRQQSQNWPYYRKIQDSLAQGKLQKCNVVIQKIYPAINNQSLVIRERQQPLHVHKRQAYTHVSGGNMEVNYKSKPVTIQINDTTVLGSILQQSSQQVKLFNQMRAVVKKSQYSLKKGSGIAIVGALSYDIATRKFKLQPTFMGYNISQIISYLSDHYMMYTLPRFFTWSMIGIGIWLAYQPAKKIFRYIMDKLPFVKRKPTTQQVQKSHLQYIKDKVVVKTSQQHVFQCVQCKVNSTEIIYYCGHLSLCQACHLKNVQMYGSSKCPVCHKTSKGEIRVFFA